MRLRKASTENFSLPAAHSRRRGINRPIFSLRPRQANKSSVLQSRGVQALHVQIYAADHLKSCGRAENCLPWKAPEFQVPNSTLFTLSDSIIPPKQPLAHWSCKMLSKAAIFQYQDARNRNFKGIICFCNLYRIHVCVTLLRSIVSFTDFNKAANNEHFFTAQENASSWITSHAVLHYPKSGIQRRYPRICFSLHLHTCTRWRLNRYEPCADCTDWINSVGVFMPPHFGHFEPRSLLLFSPFSEICLLCHTLLHSFLIYSNYIAAGFDGSA